MLSFGLARRRGPVLRALCFPTPTMEGKFYVTQVTFSGHEPLPRYHRHIPRYEEHLPATVRASVLCTVHTLRSGTCFIAPSIFVPTRTDVGLAETLMHILLDRSFSFRCKRVTRRPRIVPLPIVSGNTVSPFGVGPPFYCLPLSQHIFSSLSPAGL